jgi:hypothetical protein
VCPGSDGKSGSLVKRLSQVSIAADRPDPVGPWVPRPIMRLSVCLSVCLSCFLAHCDKTMCVLSDARLGDAPFGPASHSTLRHDPRMSAWNACFGRCTIVSLICGTPFGPGGRKRRVGGHPGRVGEHHAAGGGVAADRGWGTAPHRSRLMPPGRGPQRIDEDFHTLAGGTVSARSAWRNAQRHAPFLREPTGCISRALLRCVAVPPSQFAGLVLEGEWEALGLPLFFTTAGRCMVQGVNASSCLEGWG